MKLHEIAKKHKINFNDFKAKLISMGIDQYKSPNSKVVDEDLDKVEAIAESFIEEQSEKDEERIEQKKGTLIGTVYNERTGKFETVKLQITQKDLNNIGYEVLDSHGSVNGSILLIRNQLLRHINVDTVEKFTS